MSSHIHDPSTKPSSEQTSSNGQSNAQHTIAITLLYFAAAFTATGTASETIDLPLSSLPPSHSTADASSDVVGFPLSELGDVLARRHAGTNLDKVLKTSRWSVDAEMVDDPEGVILKGGEEVAVICPVSGG